MQKIRYTIAYDWRFKNRVIMSKEGYNTKAQGELQKILAEKQLELGKLVFVKGDPSQKSDGSAIKVLRRDIARIQTVLTKLS